MELCDDRQMWATQSRLLIERDRLTNTDVANRGWFFGQTYITADSPCVNVEANNGIQTQTQWQQLS